MNFSESDKYFLEHAIAQAKLDPRDFKVGAVITRDGQLIAEAHGGEDSRRKDHAEFTAIKRCISQGISLQGATLYTTLEPCVPDVRSPNREPCAVLILNVGITRVVIGVLDPNPGVHLKGRDMLSNQKVEVTSCTDFRLVQQIRELNKNFFEQEWPKYDDYHGFPLDRYFEGRLEQRKMLTDWTSRRGEFGGIPVMVLHGIGGIGKSSLTWLWSKRDVAGQDIPYVPDDPEEVQQYCRVSRGWASPLRIMWFSFYWYEGGGEFSCFLERAIEHFSSGLKMLGSYQTDGKTDYGRIADDLLDLLRTRRCLIIWDGAERLLHEYTNEVSDQPGSISSHDKTIEEKMALRCANVEVVRFLWALVTQETSKLLLTSRVPFADLAGKAGATHVRLNGLDPFSSVKFLKARGINGPDTVLEESARSYEFHPLSLSNLAASLLDDFQSEADITGHRPVDPGIPSDQRRNHILKLSFERRAPHRQQLLARLAAVRTPLTKNLIELLANSGDVSHESLGLDLQVLTRHGLLRSSSETQSYDMHPIVREYAHSRLHDKQTIHALLAKHYEAKAQLVSDEAVSDDLLTGTVEALYHLIKAGNPEMAYRQFAYTEWGGANRTIFDHLVLRGKWGLLLNFLEDQELISNSIGREWEPHLLQHKAKVYLHTGQLKKATESFQRARECIERIMGQILLKPNPADWQQYSLVMIQFIITLMSQASCELQLGQLEKAHHLLQEARKYLNKVNLPTMDLDRLESWLYSIMGLSKEAKRMSERGSPTAWQKADILNRMSCLHLKARLAIERSDIDAAFRLTKKLTEILANWPEMVTVKGNAEYLLGVVNLKLGHLDLAEEHLTHAFRLCRSNQELIDEAPIVLELGKLALDRASKTTGEHADKHLQCAENLAAQSLEIANWCGAALVAAEAHLLAASIAISKGKSAGEIKEHAERAKKLASCANKQLNKRYFFARVCAEAARLLKQLP